MTTPQAIPRIALTWLLVAQVLVILPHLLHLPVWIAALWLLCASWRIQIFRMRARFPNRLERIGLLVATGAAVFFSRGTLIGLDGGVLLLVATFCLKLIELRSRRDALLVIMLGFFVVVTSYLFDDSIFSTLYSLLPVGALLSALIGLQQSDLSARPAATLKLTASLMAQAVPLMLLLFLFFPRIGPLWSMPTAQKGVSGLSDSMSPADIAELSQSAELAFRASFESPLPPRQALYWRALTLEQFDGRRWSQAGASGTQAEPQWRREGQRLDYEVIMQPSGRSWLFALDVAQTDLPGVRRMADFRLEQNQPVLQNLRYRVQSWPRAPRQTELPQAIRQRTLQLPREGDTQSREWATQLRSTYGDDDELVRALLRHFNQQPYAYTLKPPVLGANSIDEFLFDTRRGFCAHYAGAMTFLLRAAGIPARVVAGYQGGEWNVSGNFLAVRQMDAHAWVEYWLPGQGWISVDPTFQVAPERIELGAEQALGEDEGYLASSPFSPLHYRNLAWLSDLRLAWDKINYNWQRWVLGYRGEEQLGLLQRWLGGQDWQRLALLLVGGGALLLGGVALWLFKPWRRERDPLQRQLRRFDRLLARQGLQRGRGEGLRDFCERASRQLPAQAEALRAFAYEFEAQRYAGESIELGRLRESLRRVRLSLPWWKSGG